MKNLIKAQFYELFHKKSSLAVFIAVIMLPVISQVYIMLDYYRFCEQNPGYSDYYDCYGSGIFISNYIGLIFAAAFAATAAGIICADDFTDRTSNFDLICNITRKQSYLGRIIPALLMIPLSLITFIIPPLLSTIVYGWGNYISVSEAAYRTFLLIFPMYRLTGLFIMLSFIIKKPFLITACGFGYLEVGAILSTAKKMAGSVRYNYFITYETLMRLMNYNTWSVGEISGNSDTIYTKIHSSLNAALTAEETALLIFSSLIAGTAYLLIGYEYYHKDDLR